MKLFADFKMPQMDKESKFELQKIDCNCNECKFMERDLVKFKFWEEYRRTIQLEEFEKRKVKAIEDAVINIELAKNDEDRRSCEGLLRVAEKMRFQFSREGMISYGHCTKLNKSVSFLPEVCQIETQHCFEHRRTTK